MKSSLRGINTFNQVTSVNGMGFWLLVDDCEYFVPFADYPVFATATIEQIFAVRQLGPRQFHWPDLDADVELDALQAPERYPLVWRS